MGEAVQGVLGQISRRQDLSQRFTYKGFFENVFPEEWCEEMQGEQERGEKEAKQGVPCDRQIPASA